MGHAMGSFSLFHWVIVIIIFTIILIPTGRILRRAGFSAWWSILAVVPFLNLVGLWILAYVRWPAGETR